MIHETHPPYQTIVIAMYSDGGRPTKHMVTIEDYKFSLTNFRKNKEVSSILVDLNLVLNHWQWTEFDLIPLRIGKKDTIHFTITDLI